MKSKLLIIFVCVVLLFMSVYSFNVYQAYIQIENGFNMLDGAFDTVGGLFGILSDRTERLSLTFNGAFGYIEVTDVNIDIATYIEQHYFPEWLPYIDDEFTVNCYVSPNYYNVALYGGYTDNFFVNFWRHLSNDVFLRSEYCIRLKIDIYGNNYRAQHNIFVLLGDYKYDDSDQLQLFYVSFDPALNTYTFNTSYNSWNEYLADTNDVTGIVTNGPNYVMTYPVSEFSFQETDVKLKDQFSAFYYFTEGIN